MNHSCNHLGYNKRLYAENYRIGHVRFKELPLARQTLIRATLNWVNCYSSQSNHIVPNNTVSKPEARSISTDRNFLHQHYSDLFLEISVLQKSQWSIYLFLLMSCSIKLLIRSNWHNSCENKQYFKHVQKDEVQKHGKLSSEEYTKGKKCVHANILQGY